MKKSNTTGTNKEEATMACSSTLKSSGNAKVIYKGIGTFIYYKGKLHR